MIKGDKATEKGKFDKTGNRDYASKRYSSDSGYGFDDDQVDGSFHTRSKFPYKQRQCFFTKNNYIYIDYKDVVTLRRFISRSGRILPQRFTSTSKTWHRKLVKAIKKARYMALLPYINRD